MVRPRNHGHEPTTWTRAEADGTIEDVAVGQKVDAWVGAIAESCPEQATADAVFILAAS
ncbi:MAG: DUF3221 domain-containing protein [Actinobacteria bacterium]|nr:DUF3221 domain-containing protein [Actinomycetota bacterium]